MESLLQSWLVKAMIFSLGLLTVRPLLLACSRKELEFGSPSNVWGPDVSMLLLQAALTCLRTLADSWVVVKIMVPFWVPQILGAVL